jgi:hypothetical protein
LDWNNHFHIHTSISPLFLQTFTGMLLLSMQILAF